MNVKRLPNASTATAAAQMYVLTAALDDRSLSLYVSSACLSLQPARQCQLEASHYLEVPAVCQAAILHDRLIAIEQTIARTITRQEF